MHIPIATYRIQFTPEFGFEKALSLVAYLCDLGISDLYASPVFKARKGSQHGYDIVDPNEINPQLGSYDDFVNLTETVRSQGMNWIQDIVPNHMAIASENTMMMDILENGPNSAYFNFFDINWNYFEGRVENKMLIPLLGKFYGESLEAGEIQLSYDQSGLNINNFDLKLPIRLESYVEILEFNADRLESRLGSQNPDFIHYLGNINFIKSLLTRNENGERNQEIRHSKKMLWNLYSSSDEIRFFIDENIAQFNGIKGNPQSFDRLNKLISEQLFRLSFWKVATEELNYRRFFTINELISVRQEDEKVFEGTHNLILQLIREGKFNGIRVDHIDGLFDPTAYLQRLRQNAGDNYIIVEKILKSDEPLPDFWPVQGTTGYDFLNIANNIFCDKNNEAVFERIYGNFTGQRVSYDELLSQKKRQIIGNYMAGDIDNLARSLKNISLKDRYGGDITLYGLRRAIVEVMAYFPVYRTYISNGFSREVDNGYIREAIDKARDRNPALFYELGFIEKFLIVREENPVCKEDQGRCMHFIMNFQQYTGPLMAKGFEDTVFYIFNRLISLNEVGGSPNEFGISSEKFHNFNRQRMKGFRHSLNSTSTHDTKRGEDVRSRINVLSEIPQEWEKYLKEWGKLNRSKRYVFKNRTIPDGNDEYFLYQTLLGSYPFAEEKDYIERIKAYIIKAVREAKVHTAWIKPDTEYEESCAAFIEEILTPSKKNKFLESFLPFQRKIARLGAFNSLSQTLIKITSPGTPDFYQGSELWDLNLVDPDNRRPVDFEMRKAYLKYIKEESRNDMPGLIDELLDNIEDGRIKLFLINRILNARKDNIDVFKDGNYIPLDAGGQFKDNIIAFGREKDGLIFITIAPRFYTRIIKENNLPLGRKTWQDTFVSLPAGFVNWENHITKQIFEARQIMFMADALSGFPVALLSGKEK